MSALEHNTDLKSIPESNIDTNNVHGVMINNSQLNHSLMPVQRAIDNIVELQCNDNDINYTLKYPTIDVQIKLIDLASTTQSEVQISKLVNCSTQDIKHLQLNGILSNVKSYFTREIMQKQHQQQISFENNDNNDISSNSSNDKNIVLRESENLFLKTPTTSTKIVDQQFTEKIENVTKQKEKIFQQLNQIKSNQNNTQIDSDDDQRLEAEYKHSINFNETQAPREYDCSNTSSTKNNAVSSGINGNKNKKQKIKNMIYDNPTINIISILFQFNDYYNKCIWYLCSYMDYDFHCSLIWIHELMIPSHIIDEFITYHKIDQLKKFKENGETPICDCCTKLSNLDNHKVGHFLPC